MGIFVALFLYLMALKVLNRDNTSKGRLIISILAGLGLWLVLALRSPFCGIDLVGGADGSVNYLNMFLTATNYSVVQIIEGRLSTFSSVEVGWFVYCKLVSLLSTDFQFFLAITAFFQIFFIGFVFYKYSGDIILSYIVYFCFGLYVMSFSGLRQSTAFTLTFFSFHFLVNKKKWLFALIVLLASSLHTSALVFLIAYPLQKIRLDQGRGIISIILVFAIVPFLSSIVSTIVPIIYGNRYQYYQDEGGSITLFLLYTLIFFFSLKIDITTIQERLCRNLIVFAVACQSLGYISTGAMTRIGFYFSIFFTLLFPELVKVYSGTSGKRILFTILALLFFAFFFLTNRGGYLNVVPYYFFWETPFIY